MICLFIFLLIASSKDFFVDNFLSFVFTKSNALFIVVSGKKDNFIFWQDTTLQMSIVPSI